MARPTPSPTRHRPGRQPKRGLDQLLHRKDHRHGSAAVAPTGIDLARGGRHPERAAPTTSPRTHRTLTIAAARAAWGDRQHIRRRQQHQNGGEMRPLTTTRRSAAPARSSADISLKRRPPYRGVPDRRGRQCQHQPTALDIAKCFPPPAAHQAGSRRRRRHRSSSTDNITQNTSALTISGSASGSTVTSTT